MSDKRSEEKKNEMWFGHGQVSYGLGLFFPSDVFGSAQIAVFPGISLDTIKHGRISPHFSHSTLTTLVQTPLLRSGRSGIWATSCL